MKRIVVWAGAAAALAGCSGPGAAHPAARAADGLRHTVVEVSASACGRGWTKPRPGMQVFDLRNTSDTAAEVYLKDARTGAVHGEVEGLAPGTVRPLRVTLGGGTFAFSCLPDDADAVTGPAVHVPGSARSGPAVRPVTQHDLIPPTLGYQKWIGARTRELTARTADLRAAIDRGDLPAARRAWLTAHLLYERMGAAYGTFGDADGKINGTTAGLPKGTADPGFTGFHRIEQGLWHGAPSRALRAPAARLAADAAALEKDWAQARMDPLDLGLRAHEIVENTIQFELTGRTDYGSGTNLATARANLAGTRTALDALRPLLRTRYPRLDDAYARLAGAEHDLDALHRGGRWTPLADLTRAQRETIDADFGDLVELLAPVAAICDVRRTS